jgi:hypothetical protein
MSMKLALATAAVALATAAGAQTTDTQTQPGSTTQPTTTETRPATTQTSPSTTTTQTTTQTAPATTTETTTQIGQAGAAAQGGAARAATRDDLKVGASVYDSQGGLVGKIEKVNADGAILSTGKARVSVPLASFGVGQVPALVVGTTRAELEAQAKPKATTKSKSK